MSSDVEAAQLSVGDEGAKRLAEALEANNTLEVLDLAVLACAIIEDRITDWRQQDNVIRDNGVVRLAEALEKNNSLKKLSLKVRLVKTKHSVVEGSDEGCADE